MSATHATGRIATNGPGTAGTLPLPGFAHAVHDAQRTFRAVLQAMARPTLPQRVEPVAEGSLRTPAPLGAGVGAVLLTLCDEQTPVWLDDALGASRDVEAWLRFHTGAPLVDDLERALFVVASSPASAPPVRSLAHGSDEAPHRSATLVVDASVAGPGESLVASGPGVDGRVAWDGAGLPPGFLAPWQAEAALFPRGVDVLIVAGAVVRALPRTTRLERASRAGTEREDA